MNAIAAVDSNWGIGYQNKLLVSIPNDMKFFRSETKGKVVVLGRKTLETFPGKRPLEQRTNIILSTDKTFTVKGGIVVHSIEELLEELQQYSTQDIYIIGGTSVYEQMLPYCDVAHITKIHHTYAADSYFPNLDQMEEWAITRDSEEQTYFDLEYQFLQYEKKVQ